MSWETSRSPKAIGFPGRPQTVGRDSTQAEREERSCRCRVFIAMSSIAEISDRRHSGRADRLRLAARLVTSIGNGGPLKNIETMCVEAIEQVVSCDRSYYMTIDHEHGSQIDVIAAPTR